MRSLFREFWRSGDPFIWFTGGALMFSLLMVGLLVGLIAVKAAGFFWPADLALVKLKDGRLYLGKVVDREKVPVLEAGAPPKEEHRIQLKVGNRDVYGLDFVWVPESEISSITYPADAVALERTEWGDFYGFVVGLRVATGGGERLIEDPGEAWRRMLEVLPEVEKIRSRIERLEKKEVGDINHRIEELRIRIRGLALKGAAATERGRAEIERHRAEIERLERLHKEKEREITSLYERLRIYKLLVRTAQGRELDVAVGSIVRPYKPNSMGPASKAAFYVSKVGEFLLDDPRESNTEGGVFPAIFGTVMMVLIMSVAVMPFGVVAAVYLKEYAKEGTFVQLVRVSVNNLAGVPSIVFGVFGVGFFIYGVGGIIDRLFYKAALPTPTFGTGGVLWASLTLALLTLPVVIVATEEGLDAVPEKIRHGSLALGATKFETLVKVVLPSAMPGILTGLILAVARATGEVAPLMLTGVVKLAPELPVDGRFPFVHLSRKFMHLGFHIYDVGFQSPNVEAAKSMVYATALLLILIVVVLNVVAIVVRNRLRKRYATGMF